MRGRGRERECVRSSDTISGDRPATAAMSAAARKALDLRQKAVAARRQVHNAVASAQVVPKPQRLGTSVSLDERQAAGRMIQQAGTSSTALQVKLVQDGEERSTHASPTAVAQR